MAIFKGETSTQIGEGLTCMKSSCEAVFSVLQIASLATGREILVAFRPKNWPQKWSQSAQFKTLFFQGEHAPDSSSLLTLLHMLIHHHNAHTSLK